MNNGKSLTEWYLEFIRPRSITSRYKLRAVEFWTILKSYEAGSFPVTKYNFCDYILFMTQSKSCGIHYTRG